MRIILDAVNKAHRWELKIYGLLFICLLAAAVWLGLDLAQGRQRILSNRLNMSIQRSQFISQWFGTTLLTADYVLREINDKAAPLIRAGAPTAQIIRLSPWLGQKVRTLPGVTGLTVYGADCVFIAASTPEVIGFHSNQRSCVVPDKHLQDKTYIQYMPADKSATHRPVILISRQILSADGKLLGGALAAIDLSFAQQWLQTFPVGDGDVLKMVDSDGTLLARNPPLPWAIGRKSTLPKNWPASSDIRASKGFLEHSALDGHLRLYGVSKIEGVPIAIVVGRGVDETLAEWQRRAWQLSAGFGALVMLTILALRAHMTTLSQREAMRKLAATDPLTGVANRRHLTDTGEQEVGRMARYGGQLSVMVVDIDHFKSINDAWGHPTGDRVIQALSRVMADCMRSQDTVGRMGGEEFIALLPQTSQEGVFALAERLRQCIGDTVVAADDGTPVKFTASIGVATAEAGESFEEVSKRADQGLYLAKRNGRDQVMRG